MFFLTWQVWIKAGKIAGYGDTTDVLRIAVGPFVYFMDAMIALTGLVHLLQDLRAAATAAPTRQRPESAMTEALIGLLAMMLLALLRIPIALAMGVVGIVGYAYMRDWSWGAAFATAQTKVYETGRNYTLSVVPLFILMGNFVTRAGMSQELYRTAYAFIGHFRGGLAMATIAGCAGFGAICGSSIATAATFAKVAYPEMKKFGYSDALATGAIASGGTLGILIPPSTIMVIYGIMTGTSIGKLFAAGILPGILAAVLLCAAVQYVTWRDPKAGPRGERLSWKERFDTLHGVVWFALVGVAVIGSAKLDLLETGRRGGARRARGVRPVARLQGRDQRDRPVRAGHGRHLRRRVHRGRRRRRRRLRRAGASRWRAPLAHLAVALRLARGKRAHHQHAVPDPDRRADVRRVRQHHLDAEGPHQPGHALERWAR